MGPCFHKFLGKSLKIIPWRDPSFFRIADKLGLYIGSYQLQRCVCLTKRLGKHHLLRRKATQRVWQMPSDNAFARKAFDTSGCHKATGNWQLFVIDRWTIRLWLLLCRFIMLSSCHWMEVFLKHTYIIRFEYMSPKVYVVLSKVYSQNLQICFNLNNMN